MLLVFVALDPIHRSLSNKRNLTRAFSCSVLEAEILGETDLRGFYRSTLTDGIAILLRK